VLKRVRSRVPVALKRRWWRVRDEARARVVASRADLSGRTPGAGRLATDDGAVTKALAARVPDWSALEAALERSELPEVEFWRAAEGVERQRLALTLGVAIGANTGLVRHAPPASVHHMADGPLGAAGSIYHADLVADALGVGGRVLDFGCSSGRVIRVLAAAFPEAELHGCDPNEAAIAWATANVPGVSFAVSPQAPPLPYPDAHFDAAYAISIWSHFDAQAAETWLDEMARVVRGRLLLTAHGYDALADYARRRARSPLVLARMRQEVDEHGFSFAPHFGAGGDDGVSSPHWGESFMAPEWLLSRLAPHWVLVDFAAGRNEGNQDVYVLERRADS
jgi:SAM-dependent methyltransferase